MSIFPWIYLGLLAGYIASKLVNENGESVFLGVALVLTGAIYGGFLFTWLSAAGVTGFNLHGMFMELVGVVAVVAVYHARFIRQLPA